MPTLFFPHVPYAGCARLFPPARIVFLLTCLLAICAPCIPASAQEAAKPPKEVLVLFDMLDDIDKLRVLNPLKLSSEQMDKMIAAVKGAQASYDKKCAELLVPPIRRMAEEIRQRKQQMLRGSAIPKAFDDQVKKLQDTYVQQRDKANVANWLGLVATMKTILTPEQVALATKLAKQAANKTDATTKEQDEKWFNLYVLQVFISYPRIVPLLQEMKAAKASVAASSAPGS